MTNREKYKNAFSSIGPSEDFAVEVEKMAFTKKKNVFKPVAAALAICLILGTGGVAYAKDLNGIQRTIQLWIHGEQTDAVFEVNYEEGTYALDYTDANGEKKHRAGGGVAFNLDGTKRPVTEEEIWEELNAPEVEYKEDGAVWLYYGNQKMEITDMFEDDVCYIQLIRDGKPLYLTIKYQKGYGASPNKYMSPLEFN